MQHIRDPQQNQLFDVWDRILSPMAYTKLKEGWQGVFREVILELLPVDVLAGEFDPDMGRPTKELYSMAGLLLIKEFKGWTAQEAAEAYMYHADIQFALNLEPACQQLSSRTVERYEAIFVKNELAAEVMERVTMGIVEELELDVSRQRLDSTHIFSDMAIFGRTRLMGVAVKRFLTQLKRHNREEYEKLPEELRERYRPSKGRLFGDVASDRDARRKLRQTVAEEMQLLVERFADDESIRGRTTYREMLQIFEEQCEVVDEDVEVKDHPGGDVVQNPSDLDATREGQKGAGYKAQVSETCSPENDVQLLLLALPQTGAEDDTVSFPEVLRNLERCEILPEALFADAKYGSDENVRRAAEKGVELHSPVSGPKREDEPYELNIDDFVVTEATEEVQRCPAGAEPEESCYNEEKGRTRTVMPAGRCMGCEYADECPVGFVRGEAVLRHTPKQRRLAARRREQDTEAFRETYSIRSGGESAFSGLKRRLGLDRVRVRRRPAVSYKIWMKVAAWNVLRAAASEKLRRKVAQSLGRRARFARKAPRPTPVPVYEVICTWILSRLADLLPNHVPARPGRHNPIGLNPVPAFARN